MSVYQTLCLMIAVFTATIALVQLIIELIKHFKRAKKKPSLNFN